MTVQEEASSPLLAVLGGTGAQGMGLAYRLDQAGVGIIIGSREESRAKEAAKQLGPRVRGATNPQAAKLADLALIAVPWAGHEALCQELVAELAGKIVIDCVNPLGFDKQGPHPLSVPEGSAAEQAQAILADSVVVGAFHNVSAVKLADADLAEVDTDVLVTGESREATGQVQELIDRIPGMRGVYAGRLRNTSQIESLTANLIAINRRYKIHSGIRITDLPED